VWRPGASRCGSRVLLFSKDSVGANSASTVSNAQIDERHHHLPDLRITTIGDTWSEDAEHGRDRGEPSPILDMNAASHGTVMTVEMSRRPGSVGSLKVPVGHLIVFGATFEVALPVHPAVFGDQPAQTRPNTKQNESGGGATVSAHWARLGPLLSIVCTFCHPS